MQHLCVTRAREMRKQSQRSHRLVLVPCPYQGHINPMLQLGTILYSRGFSITIAHTIYNSPNPHDHPDFSFLPLPDGLSDRDLASRDIVAHILAMNDNCKESFSRSIEQLMEEKKLQGEMISCIISDELMFFAEDVAHNLKLPSIILRTTSATTSLARPGLVKLKEDGRVPYPFRGPFSHDLVPELQPLRFKDLPFTSSPDFGKFTQLVAKAYTTNRKSSAIVWNTTDCLEQSTLEQIQQQSQVPIFPIGPIHKMAAATISSSLIEEDRSCISWLDKQPHDSVIYVSSLGSIASIGEREVTEVPWGLANSKQPFLWVRPDSIQGSGWIEVLPKGLQDAVGDKGCIVRWAPQREVLAHPAVGGFWSHCGWNSTLESMAEGVPIICKPCFSDQRVNARYVSHVWRVGLELEELEKREVERAVRTLMLDDEGKEMRKRAKELKEKIEACTREGGSSYNSLNQLVNFITLI